MVKKLILLLALGGCTLAPTYQRPAAPIPAAWPDTVKAGARQMPDWKTYYPDPRLQALISAALQNNRDLRIATARIAEARAQYGIQQASQLPNVNLNASHSASLSPASTSFTGRPFQAQRYDVNASLVSFELDFWGRVSSLNAAAKASYLATESAQRAFRLSLISDVASAYLATLELQQRLQIANLAVKGRGEFRDLISRRRDAGVAGDMESLQADAAYHSAKAELANLQRQQSAAENLLSQLVGGMPENLPQGLTLAEQGISNDLLAGLPSEVLLQRPDVQAAEQRLIASNANIGAVRAAFLPSISLTGSFGSASRQMNGLFGAGSDAWSFQPSISLPLFDAGRNSANLDVAQARRVIAVADYEKTIQTAFREVADLLAARDSLGEQLAAARGNSAALQQRLALVDARYRSGLANHLELLDAERDVYAAQQLDLQVLRAQLSSSVQLYKALASNDAQ